MAKKIRFPLEMDQGIEVRTVNELKEHFVLSRVLMYLSNGKLDTWLRDRYEEDLADSIELLDQTDEGLPRKICELFNVSCDETDENEWKKERIRESRLSLLKKYTTEQRYYDAVDKVAFNEKDLSDLLNDGIKDIYLCGKTFLIPLSKIGISYTGINNPVVIIESQSLIDWEEKGILLSAVKYDDNYQAVVDSYVEKEKKKSEHIIDDTSIVSNDIKPDAVTTLDSYYEGSYLYSMISDNNSHSPEWYFNKIIEGLNQIPNDILHDISTDKFESLIYNINLKINKKPRKFINRSDINLYLAMIYDYDKLNEYGKIIMEESYIYSTSDYKNSPDPWISIFSKRNELMDENNCFDTVEQFIQFCKFNKNTKEGYKFIFWALMILTVDARNIKEHLSLICDFAQILFISNKEITTILNGIKSFYLKDVVECNVNSFYGLFGLFRFDDKTLNKEKDLIDLVIERMQF